MIITATCICRKGIRQLSTGIDIAKQDVDYRVARLLSQSSRIKYGSDVDMVVPSNSIERTTRTIYNNRIVACRSHGSDSLLPLETSREVLSIIPFSTLGSEIDNTCSSIISGGSSISRLDGMVEVVKVCVDLGKRLSGTCLKRFVKGDEIWVVGVRGPETSRKSTWVVGR